MQVNLDLLKEKLNKFIDESKISPEKIGILADESASIEDFKNRLDHLCRQQVGKTSLEILAGTSTRLPEMKTNQKIADSQRSENSPLQNELVELERKFDQLKEREVSGKTRSNI